MSDSVYIPEKCNVCGTSRCFHFSDEKAYCHRCSWHSENPVRVVTPFTKMLMACDLQTLVTQLEQMKVDFNVRRNANKYYVTLSTPQDRLSTGSTNVSLKSALVDCLVKFFEEYTDIDYHNIEKVERPDD